MRILATLRRFAYPLGFLAAAFATPALAQSGPSAEAALPAAVNGETVTWRPVTLEEARTILAATTPERPVFACDHTTPLASR